MRTHDFRPLANANWPSVRAGVIRGASLIRARSCCTAALDRTPPASLVSGHGTGVASIGAGFDDLGDLLHCEVKLVVGREVVRAETDAGVRPEVAQDPARLELGVDGRELGHAHGDRPSPPRGLARAHDLEAGLVRELDQ